MTRFFRRSVPRLVRPLVMLWLLLSNAAWCQLGVPTAQEAGSHAQHHQHATHDPAGSAAHHVPLDNHVDCCASAFDYPCCAGNAYAPAFDSPADATPSPAAIVGPEWAFELPRYVPPVLRAVVSRPPPAGPPLFVRCCSWLI